ncbi:MAG TPA: fibronectin type III domain-containing protein [Fimbriimonadaceae bacterium]|nr:fibronectin type III domain-containing protein [Fimbriimonadaceae bacterium]
MKLSQLGKLSDLELAADASAMAATISAAPATFGLTAPQAAEMSDIAELFNDSISAAEAARVAAESSSFDKDLNRETLLSIYSQYLNLMYATPSVTASEIMTLGLEPRSTTRTPLVPVTPEDVLATPFANGTVKITWSRGGNKYGVVYEVECSDADESNWAVCGTTTKQNITLAGFEPGVPKWFPFGATKNGAYSDYSFNSGIYIPVPGLSLAA